MSRFILLLIFLPSLTHAQDQLRITYIGNMGVLIAANDRSVVIDGLHDLYRPAYQYPSEVVLEKLRSRQPAIDLILNTHVHDDHFDAEMSAAFLRDHPACKLAGPDQVHEKLQVLKEQTISLAPAVGQRFSFSHRDIKVAAFALKHIGSRHRQIQNIGYLVSLGEYKVLHIGDTDWNEEIYEQLALQASGVDVAIVPNWMALTERGAAVVEKYIRPKAIIVTHISPADAAMTKQQVLSFFSEAVLFTVLEQEYVVGEEP